jgi:hypothetical protein
VFLGILLGAHSCPMRSLPQGPFMLDRMLHPIGPAACGERINDRTYEGDASLGEASLRPPRFKVRPPLL